MRDVVRCAEELEAYGAKVLYASLFEMFCAWADEGKRRGVIAKYGGKRYLVESEDCAPKITTPAAKTTALGLFIERNTVWVSSRDVADRFEKNHKDVMRSVKNLDCTPIFNQRNFAPVEYIDNKGEKRPQYLMTRDGFTFLAMGFTGKKAAAFKEAYINEFNRMEEELRGTSALQYEAERKKSLTSMSTAAAARRSEQAMRRKLNNALIALASFKR